MHLDRTFSSGRASQAHAGEWLAEIPDTYRIMIEPVTVEQAQIAHGAYHGSGICSGHRAKLNVGDCFSYALAKATGQLLLFKGHDIVHTDVRRAVEPD